MTQRPHGRDGVVVDDGANAGESVSTAEAETLVWRRASRHCLRSLEIGLGFVGGDVRVRRTSLPEPPAPTIFI